MKRIPLFLLLFCATFCVTSARRHVFNLADYGILPNDTAKNLGSRLQTVLQTIASKANDGDELVVRLKKGRYDFYADDASSHELYISNHDQDNPKRVAIFLENLQRFTFDGGGAQFVLHGRLIPVALIGSSDVTLRNFSIDFAQPQIAQVEIVENRADSGMVFRVIDGTDYRIGSNDRFEVYGDGWTVQPASGIAFEAATRHIAYNTGDLSINTTGCVEVADRTLLAPNWQDARLVVGTRVAMRGWERPCPGLFLSDNTRTTVSSVKVHYAEGMGLLAQRCSDVTLRNFSVCCRSKSDDRYFTTQADATHFSQCRGRIVCEDGFFEGMMDDAINVHGIYLRVRERLDNYTLRCRYEHEQAWGFAWGNVGDTVSFIRSATMDTVGATNVITSIRPADKSEVKGCREFLIMFASPLPDAVSMEESYGVENLSWTPEVVFRRNTVRNNRARGALFSTPRHTVCERNLFDHTSGSAILLCGDCNGWYESGAVRNLVIRKNRFVNALTSLYQFTNAVIAICPEIPDLKAQRGYFHGGCERSIIIENNVFETFDKPLLYAKSVYGLVFKDNKVKENNAYEPFHWNTQAVRLDRCNKSDIPSYVSRPKTFIRLK